ncbi:MAG: DNA repair protein RecO [Verrucomicrobiota bacterium]
MDERTTGLILRIRPLTETSSIVQWLTPDLGRVATVAKGARRPKSPFRGKLDLFYLADFSFQRSRRSELHNLREVVLRETNVALRKEILYLQQASYCATLIEQTTETETPLGNIFQLMSDFLTHLPSRPPQPLTILAFEMKLLNELGLNPDLAEAKLSAGAKQILQKFVELDWENLLRLKLSKAQEIEIRQFLNGFLIFHLGKIPKGRNSAFQFLQ